MMEKIIFVMAGVYLIIINLTGFIMMGIDKKRAVRNDWRIKEKTLFIIAIMGGSPGVLLGMNKFRHKTKHKSFVYGIPAILIVQFLALLAVQFIVN